MSARRKSENHDAGIGIAKPGHRFAPVIPLKVGTPFLARDPLSIGDQAWAADAGDDFLIESSEPGGQACHADCFPIGKYRPRKALTRW